MQKKMHKMPSVKCIAAKIVPHLQALPKERGKIEALLCFSILFHKTRPAQRIWRLKLGPENYS
jgi:hypothetical protein